MNVNIVNINEKERSKKMAKITWKKVPSMLGWNKLKTLRLEKKLTQVQVSAYSDVAVATIWMIEAGYDERVTKETKRKLCVFFECDISDLFPVEMIGDITREEHFKELEKG